METKVAIDLCTMNYADGDTDQSTPQKGAEREDEEQEDLMQNLLTTLSLIEVPMTEPMSPGIKHLIEVMDMQIDDARFKKSKTFGAEKKNVR